MNVGPDAARYLHASQGVPVPRPFHLRWLLPKLCGDNLRHWQWIWGASWPLAAVGMFWWQSDHGWQIAAAATALLLGLSGILGPELSIPVQIDLPATALTLLGCAMSVHVHPIAGVVVFVVAATIRETAPVWAALWLWSLWPLIAVFPVIVAAAVLKSGPDPLGDPRLRRIAEHPFRTALEYHHGQWRDGWLLVAPFGATLAALINPDWRLIVILIVAHLQLLIATDTVRLVHHAAGPPMAIGAAMVIPVSWLLFAVVVHIVWWRTPERV